MITNDWVKDSFCKLRDYYNASSLDYHKNYYNNFLIQYLIL